MKIEHELFKIVCIVWSYQIYAILLNSSTDIKDSIILGWNLVLNTYDYDQ